MEEYIEELNQSQREAVLYNDGPLLVIAGAGSGKTRVLTYKIAYLIQQGYHPYSILALTFTNKAAAEMKTRVASIVSDEVAAQLWMGTFHSVFCRILRREAVCLGFHSDFTIYDTSDSKSLVKSIIKEMSLDEKKYRPSYVCSIISKAKNALIEADKYENYASLMQADYDAGVPKISQIYKRYIARCKVAQSMDFDDLLLYTNILFRDNPSVLEKYQHLFSYVLVDEYQDTNFSQHLLVKKLVAYYNHLCMVGDDAQSIYSFRGAEIENILSFQNNYSTGKMFKLEQNYRSTQTIVNAANSLIDKNVNQIRKNIFSEKEIGEKLFVVNPYSDIEEGIIVANKIIERKMTGGYAYSDFAVLYRTNAQSRIFEEEFRKQGISYRIYGGLSFYQRKEIKDIIAYFRLVVNPQDEEALKRVINYPVRGIGATSLAKIAIAATEYNTSFWNVLIEPERYLSALNKGTIGKINLFTKMIQSFMLLKETKSAYDLAFQIITESGIKNDLYSELTQEALTKQENVQELLNGIALFVQMRKEEGNESDRLIDFLSEVSLLTDQDLDGNDEENRVSLMTVHAAKGLEFKNVLIVGLEEGLFPARMSMDSNKAIEEERRLLYVAITRAKEYCFLSHAKSRYRNGNLEFCAPSRFLNEIDDSYVNRYGDERRKPQLIENTPSFYPNKTEQIHFSSSFSAKNDSILEKTNEGRRMSRLQSVQNKSTVSSASLSISFQIGDRVSHERFGEGVVKNIEGEGANKKILVLFDNSGEKKLLLKFARIDKL